MGNNRVLSVLSVLTVSLLNMQSVQASSAFSSTAIITYTIDSIVNTTGAATDLNGLNITAGFELSTFDSYIDIPNASDGQATAINSSGGEYVDPVVGSYSKAMTVNGSVSNGIVDTYYLGWFNLNFENLSSNEFDIQVTLDYQLASNATGDDATSEIQLDYLNEAVVEGAELNDVGSFASGDGGFSVYASTVDGSPESLNGSAVYNFTVGVEGFDGLYVDVGIAGNLEATSPVPVPAAFWMFATALVLPAFKRFKQQVS